MTPPHRAGHRARPRFVGALALVLVGVPAGCSTHTPVELDSARPPIVQPVDGGEGQNEAGVIEAGAIDLDDEPVDRATTSTGPATTTTVQPAGPTTTVEPRSADAQAMIDIMCKNDRRALRAAVDNYRVDLGAAPTSEGDLIAMAYLRKRSDLFDVWADGSIVAQNSTCA